MRRFWRKAYAPQVVPCPMQAQGTMASQAAHVCVWHTDTWSDLRIWHDWLRDRKSKYMNQIEKALGRKLPWRRDRFSGGTYWPAGEPRPRTCSYCGGVHPDDSVLLIMRGWEVETTTKTYKRYLHPPGHRAAIAETEASGFSTWIGPRSPVPPVKLYTYHFDERQADAFNAALDFEPADKG